MPYNPTVHHRRSIRLKGYDYRQAGAYFVTIVTQERLCCFGEVNGKGRLYLNHKGRLIQTCWEAIPRHADHVQLDLFVVMPNHLHGILWIIKDIIPAQDVITVPPKGTAPPPPTGTTPGSLNAIIQNFKSVTTRKLNQQARTPGTSLWQRDYYESVIRDDAHLAAIRDYIRHNPAHWHLDRERPFDPDNGLWI
jgi:putative transposase